MFLSLYLDHFPAQAVVAYDAARRARPFVVVCQDPDSHKCAVFACSPLAKARGIRRGQFVAQLRKRHPDLDVVLRNEDFERTARDELAWLLDDLSPVCDVKPSGRCQVDLSGTPAERGGDLEAVARALQSDIAQKIGLPDVAVGIADSRLIAGMLARLARPRGLRVCRPGEEADTLASLSADLLPVSPRIREKMNQYGVRQVGQIQRLGKDALVVRLGAEGEKLYSLSIGLDAAPSRPQNKNAIEAETVLDRDINDERALLQHVRHTADKLCHTLKTQRAWALRCTVVITYTDNRTAQRTAAFASPTHALDVVAPAAAGLFRELYGRRVAVKSIRLVVNQPRRDTGQLDLFESARDRKRRAVSDAVTAIRERMGFDAVVHGENFDAVSAPEDTISEPDSRGSSENTSPADFLDDAHQRWK